MLTQVKFVKLQDEATRCQLPQGFNFRSMDYPLGKKHKHKPIIKWVILYIRWP